MPRRAAKLTHFSFQLSAFSFLLIAAWLAGRILSDHWAWSQWLLWIPTPVALLAAAGWLLAGPAPRRRRRRVVRALVLVGVSVWFLFVEHRWQRLRDAPAAGMSIAHWNLADLGHGDRDAYARAVTALEADVWVLANAGSLEADARIARWTGERHAHATGPFTIASRWPILDVTRLVAADAIEIVRVTVDAGGAGPPRSLRLWLVDLPSGPGRGRMATVERALALAASRGGIERPDVIVGDLNITRGAASLEVLAPGFAHAFDRAGRGYGATWPRRWPLWHIDHVLVGPGVVVERYDISDPGVGSHRMQVAWLRTS